MLDIIENAAIAKTIWNSFSRADEIIKYFHLRPTNSGFTIVTTLSGYEMRGRSETSKEGLIKALEEISDKYRVLVSIDEKKRKKAMKDLGFKKRVKRGIGHGIDLEEVIQATMINTMSDDHNLAKALGVQKVEFIASEVILKKGRVDIIGFDRGAKILYLFELKKGRTLKVEQALNYVKHYESKEVRGELENLLQVYPINAVDEINKIKGVMVMKYAGNSDCSKWEEIKEKTGIDILFYEPSLSYSKRVCS